MKPINIPVAIATVALCAATVASQTPPAGAPQPNPILPVAVSVLTSKPDSYIGGMVSLTAAVDQPFGASAFSIVQGRGAGKPGQDLLVIAPILTAPVAAGAYVTVIGEVVRFEPSDVAAKMKGNAPALDADTVAKYRGRPAILATSVINAAMTDLAKRLPPPMTSEEEAFSRLMKQVGPAFNGLRQAVAAANTAEAGAQAAMLKKLFGESTAFWKTKTHPDALQWAADAQKLSADIEAAAAKGSADELKATVPKLQSVCGSCHGQYRERLDDGTYRYKPR